MEALVLPELEKIAHIDLVAPGALRARNINTMGGHSQRAYNSVFNWPGARFPRGCQEYRVAEMLSIGSYDILVLSLCCNDISNLTLTPIKLHLFFAETSGLNTLHIAENALCRFPKLKKVVILDAPPRIEMRWSRQNANQKVGPDKMPTMEKKSRTKCQPRLAFCPVGILSGWHLVLPPCRSCSRVVAPACMYHTKGVELMTRHDRPSSSQVSCYSSLHNSPPDIIRAV